MLPSFPALADQPLGGLSQRAPNSSLAQTAVLTKQLRHLATGVPGGCQWQPVQPMVIARFLAMPSGPKGKS
jgi:hypothetical protein